MIFHGYFVGILTWCWQLMRGQAISCTSETAFKRTVDELALIDMPMQRRHYTWSNAREKATLVRHDRFLISQCWNQQFPATSQKALPSVASYHCPILFTCSTKFSLPNTFQFENYWLRLIDFIALVQNSWTQSATSRNPIELRNKLIKLRQKIINLKTRWIYRGVLQKFKFMIMPDLLQVYNHVLRNPECTLRSLNNSYIVLIPKKKEALLPSDFRLISIINAIQRIFSKIITERIQSQLQSMLQPTQTEFLKGRHITEGFHYAQEIISAARSQSTQMALFKDDIYKAFDTINWQFILDCMQARGFSQQWIKWIKHLILQGQS
jgi:Reverse transcriptase (RNA-dependent DNA polymerase)